MVALFLLHDSLVLGFSLLRVRQPCSLFFVWEFSRRPFNLLGTFLFHSFYGVFIKFFHIILCKYGCPQSLWHPSSSSPLHGSVPNLGGDDDRGLQQAEVHADISMDSHPQMSIASIFGWVSPAIFKFYSIYLTDESIIPLREGISLSSLDKENTFTCLPCSTDDGVFMEVAEHEPTFCYFYKTLFAQLFIRLPFSKLYCDVLNTLNVAPTLLHPNSWAFMNAFVILCCSINMKVSASRFLYLFL